MGATGDRGRYGDQVALLAQLEIALADGSTMTIATDDDWRSSTGEVRSADFYDGCSIDLRERRVGWDLPEFDDSAWPDAVEVPLDIGIVEPRSAPPVRAIKKLKPTASSS